MKKVGKQSETGDLNEQDLTFMRDNVNKVVCGDCLELMKQLPDNSVDLIVTDPPYNLKKDFANDNMIWEDFISWSNKWITEFKRILKPAGNLLIFGDFESLSRTYIKLLMDLNYKETLVWYKRNGGYTNKYELILRLINPSKDLLIEFGNYIKLRRNKLGISLKEIGKLCDEDWYHRGGNLFFETGLNYPNMEQYIKLKEVLHLNNVYDSFIYRLNKNSITISESDGKGNVLDYLVGDCLVGGVQLKNKVHCTQKPLKLIRRLINKLSKHDDVVFDPFLGSGTTAVACKQLERNFIGFEISPEYCEIARKRLEQSNIKEWF